MDDVVSIPPKPQPRRFGVWIIIALLVFYPEAAVTLYILLSVILAVRMHWLLHQGLSDLRRRYPS